jgi:hypothetical protein
MRRSAAAPRRARITMPVSWTFTADMINWSALTMALA